MLGVDPHEQMCRSKTPDKKTLIKTGSKDPHQPQKYMMGVGAILDLPIKCEQRAGIAAWCGADRRCAGCPNTALNGALNEQVHGAGVTAEQVLQVQEHIPAELSNLYT